MKGYVVDLSRKILIFLDQPHNELLARLRPLLSHDKKEISLKITDRSQKFGLKTKNVLLKGYPSVIFCTAGLKIDEQEATRFLLLSPEVGQGKIRQGILESIKKEADSEQYAEWLNENPARLLLKERLKAIKTENVKEIKIANREKIEQRFLSQNKMLKPRHQRDIKRLMSLIKAFALLNLWWRERNGSTIIANDEDIEQAFRIWDKISQSQELNLPPYIYNLYQEVILKAYNDKNANRNEDFVELTGTLGLSRKELLQKHYEVYGRMLDTSQLRLQILPMLETAGLITQEQDPNDKRNMLIYPTVPYTISQDQNNSGHECRVKMQHNTEVYEQQEVVGANLKNGVLRNLCNSEDNDKMQVYPTPQSPISPASPQPKYPGEVCCRCGGPSARKTWGRDNNGKWGVACFCNECTV